MRLVNPESSDATRRRVGRLPFAVAVAVLMAFSALFTNRPVAAQADAAVTWQTYQDSKGRFSFEYPSSFGAVPAAGTDDSFASQLTVFFRDINATAVLTSGPVEFSRAAMGGLYDEVALQGVTIGDQVALRRERPAVTASNFCDAMKSEETPTWIDTLDDRLHAEAGMINALNNADPQVRICEGTGQVRHFVKDVATSSDDLRRHIFGSVNFLGGQYSSFQMIRVSATAPDAAKLADLDRVVGSIKIGGK